MLRRSGLFLALVALVTGTAFGNAWGANPFTDITGNTHADNIDAIYNAGITAGCAQGPTSYCPSDNVTRAQMASFLARLGGLSSDGALNLPKLNGRSAKRAYCSVATRRPRSFDTSVCRGSLTRFPTPLNIDGLYTSIAIGADGFPIISYRDQTNNFLRVVRCTDAVCATRDTPMAPDAAAGGGYWSSIAIGVDEFPIIAHYDESDADLKIVHCTHFACETFDPAITADSDDIVGEYPNIAIGIRGAPVISYIDVSDNSLNVLRCDDSACLSRSGPFTPQTALEIEDLSMAIATNGFPVMSYFDVQGGDLEFVRCTSGNCDSADDPITLDGAGVVGRESSIAIGVDGFPIISYYDATNKDLKVVHCANTSCTVRDDRVSPDTVGDVGGLTSITIGLDGLPVIAYRDATNELVKFLQCANVACSAWGKAIDLDSAPPAFGAANSMTLGVDGIPILSYLSTSDLKIAQPPVS